MNYQQIVLLELIRCQVAINTASIRPDASLSDILTISSIRFFVCEFVFRLKTYVTNLY